MKVEAPRFTQGFVEGDGGRGVTWERGSALPAGFQTLGVDHYTLSIFDFFFFPQRIRGNFFDRTTTFPDLHSLNNIILYYIILYYIINKYV